MSNNITSGATILPSIAEVVATAAEDFAYRYLNERISLFTLSLWNIFWIFGL